MCTRANTLTQPDFWEGERLCITSESCTGTEGFAWGILTGRSCRAPARPVGDGRNCGKWDGHKPALHCHSSLLLSTSQLRERGRASCLLLGMVRGGLHAFQVPSETRRVQGHFRPPCICCFKGGVLGSSPGLNPSFKQALLCKSLDAADCYCKLQREKVLAVPGLSWDMTAKSANPTAHRGPSCGALRARHQHGKKKSCPWQLHATVLVHLVGREEGFLRSIKKKGASCRLLKPPPA